MQNTLFLSLYDLIQGFSFLSKFYLVLKDS